MGSLRDIEQWPVDHAGVAVVNGGEVVESAGDLQRVFELASVTKLLVAYGVLVAVEEGGVELDQPAGPEGSTVRHLLAHASGLAMDEHRTRAEPGKRRIYSSAGYEVLADFVAEQTGIGFADYLHEAVFEPLQMAATELVGSPGHGARSSVDDLSKFAAELLNPRVISRRTLDEATKVQFERLDGVLPGYGSRRPNDWGLGFELRDDKDPHWTGSTNSHRTFGHFGQSGTFLWVDPDIATACIVLTDRDFGDWAKPLWPELSDAVVAGMSG